MREDFIEICDGSHCRALILGLFEFWLNIKLKNREQAEIENQIAKKDGMQGTQSTELWVWKTLEQISEEMLGLFKVRKIGSEIKWLVDNKLLLRRNNPKYSWDRTYQYTVNVELVQSLLNEWDKKRKQTENANPITQKCAINKVNQRVQKCENAEAIPKITTETTTDINISNDIPISPEKTKSIPYDEVVSEYHKHCPSLPKVRFLTDKRKQMIKARWKTHKDLSVFIEIFKKAEASDFLSGRNGKWTNCNFDWLLNETNMAKVLEGNYDNKGGDGNRTDARTLATGYGQGSQNSEYAGFIGGG